jgi:hypothetical protein
MTTYYVWKNDEIGYYSTSGFGIDGTSNENVLDYVFTLMAADETVYVGTNSSGLDVTFIGIRIILSHANKIIRANPLEHGAYGLGTVTLKADNSYFFYHSGAVDGMIVRGPFVADGSTSTGYFWYANNTVVNSIFEEITFKNFTANTTLDFGPGISDSTLKQLHFESSCTNNYFDDSPASSNNTFEFNTIQYSPDASSFLYFDGTGYDLKSCFFYGHGASFTAFKYRGLNGSSIREIKLISCVFLDYYTPSGDYLESGRVSAQDYGGSGVTLNDINSVHLNPIDYVWASVGTNAVINTYNSLAVGSIGLTSTGGALNHYSNYLLSNWYRSTSQGNIDASCVTIDSKNNAINFKHYAPPFGAIIPCLDDTENHLDPNGSNQRDIVDVWISKNVRGILFFQAGSIDDPVNGIEFSGDALIEFTTLVSYHADGLVDVGIHSMSHNDLSENVIFTIKKDISIDTETATITITTNGIVIDCTNTDANLDLPFSTYPTMWDIYDAINGSGYYTAVNSKWEDDSCYAMLVISSLFAQIDTVSIPVSTDTPLDVNYNINDRFEFEIGNSKAWVLAHFPAATAESVNAFATPGGDASADLINWLVTTEDQPEYGIKFTRSLVRNDEYSGSYFDLKNLNTRAVQVVDWELWAGGDCADWESETITYDTIFSRGVAMAEYVKVKGIVLMPYSHGTETEANAAMWSALLDGIRSVDSTLLKSTQTVLEYIRSGTQDESAPEVWKQDWSSDYSWGSLNLAKSSSLIDMGELVTGVHDQGDADPWGKYLYRLPNIGADQGAGAPKQRQQILRIGSPGI